VWRRPAATALTPTPVRPETSTGTGEPASVAFPSWPRSLAPQHTTEPVPSCCSATQTWASPLLMPIAGDVPSTSTGTSESPPGPPPVSDSRPQQRALPTLGSAHVWVPPALKEVVSEMPTTGTAFGESVVLPSPSCPAEFAPQHDTPPSTPMLHACAHPITGGLLPLDVGVTLTGKGEDPRVPSPSWPTSLRPQQAIDASAKTAQLEPKPAPTDATPCNGVPTTVGSELVTVVAELVTVTGAVVAGGAELSTVGTVVDGRPPLAGTDDRGCSTICARLPSSRVVQTTTTTRRMSTALAAATINPTGRPGPGVGFGGEPSMEGTPGEVGVGGVGGCTADPPGGTHPLERPVSPPTGHPPFDMGSEPRTCRVLVRRELASSTAGLAATRLADNTRHPNG